MTNAWVFVAAAYAVTAVGTAGLVGWALATMVAAERRAERR